MNTMTSINTTRQIHISVGLEMFAHELKEFVESHLGYVSRAHGFHVPFVGEVQVHVEIKDCFANGYTVDIDFSTYTQEVRNKFSEVEDSDISEALDGLIENLKDQMIYGSPTRKNNTRLIPGYPELAGKFESPSYDVVPAPAPDVIAEFTAESSGANNVELYEMFIETLEKVREEERAKADARVEAVKREAELKIATMNQTTNNIVEILTKEAKALATKNDNLSKLAGIPKFRRTTVTRVVKRNTRRSPRS